MADSTIRLLTWTRTDACLAGMGLACLSLIIAGSIGILADHFHLSSLIARIWGVPFPSPRAALWDAICICVGLSGITSALWLGLFWSKVHSRVH